MRRPHGGCSRAAEQARRAGQASGGERQSGSAGHRAEGSTAEHITQAATRALRRVGPAPAAAHRAGGGAETEDRGREPPCGAAQRAAGPRDAAARATGPPAPGGRIADPAQPSTSAGMAPRLGGHQPEFRPESNQDELHGDWVFARSLVRTFVETADKNRELYDQLQAHMLAYAQRAEQAHATGQAQMRELERRLGEADRLLTHSRESYKLCFASL